MFTALSDSSKSFAIAALAETRVGRKSKITQIERIIHPFNLRNLLIKESWFNS